MSAQLGFCGGNSGDPIFIEDFGAGTVNTPLPFGTTTYTFASTQPDDGFYTVSNRTNWFSWHDIQDHTPGDSNGKSLVVNVDFTAAEFYRTPISRLCENTSYEFSSWIINLIPTNHPFCCKSTLISILKINVTNEVFMKKNINIVFCIQNTIL